MSSFAAIASLIATSAFRSPAAAATHQAQAAAKRQ